MWMPLSPKTVFRLHRKLFRLRSPRFQARCGLTLGLYDGKQAKKPLATLHLEKKRKESLCSLLLALALGTVTLLRCCKGK